MHLADGGSVAHAMQQRCDPPRARRRAIQPGRRTVIVEDVEDEMAEYERDEVQQPDRERNAGLREGVRARGRSGSCRDRAARVTDELSAVTHWGSAGA